MADDVEELSYHYLSDLTLMSKDFANLMKYYWSNSLYTNYFNLFKEGYYYPTLKHECFSNAERYQDFLASCAYQWYYYDTSSKTWIADNRFQNKKVSFVPAAEENGRLYKCIASCAAGSYTSNIITIKGTTSSPVIAYLPLSITVQLVESICSYSFKVTISSDLTDTATYQWYYSQDSGGSWKKIKGATSDEYIRENADSGWNGYLFRCIVTYGGTTYESDAATLTIKETLSNEFIKQPSNVCYTTYSDTGKGKKKITLSVNFSIQGGLIELIDGLKNNLGISSTTKKTALFGYKIQGACAISSDPSYSIRCTGRTDKIIFMECRDTGWS